MKLQSKIHFNPTKITRKPAFFISYVSSYVSLFFAHFLRQVVTLQELLNSARFGPDDLMTRLWHHMRWSSFSHLLVGLISFHVFALKSLETELLQEKWYIQTIDDFFFIPWDLKTSTCFVPSRVWAGGTRKDQAMRCDHGTLGWWFSLRFGRKKR